MYTPQLSCFLRHPCRWEVLESTGVPRLKENHWGLFCFSCDERPTSYSRHPEQQGVQAFDYLEVCNPYRLRPHFFSTGWGTWPAGLVQSWIVRCFLSSLARPLWHIVGFDVLFVGPKSRFARWFNAPSESWLVLKWDSQVSSKGKKTQLILLEILLLTEVTTSCT